MSCMTALLLVYTHITVLIPMHLNEFIWEQSKLPFISCHSLSLVLCQKELTAAQTYHTQLYSGHN